MVQMTKTTKSASAKNFQHGWKLIDLDGQVLGRAANEIAMYLQGKHIPTYSPNLDFGDNVVVINATKVVVSGNKVNDKLYTTFSGYPSGLRTMTYKEMMAKSPADVIRHAVSGMLPKNKLRDQRLARLFVFPDGNHKFADKFTK